LLTSSPVIFASPPVILAPPCAYTDIELVETAVAVIRMTAIDWTEITRYQTEIGINTLLNTSSNIKKKIRWWS
jgi:hypothetical protein